MGKKILIMELCQLLVSVEFAFVMYFLFIRGKEDMTTQDKKFQAFVIGLSAYIIIRILTLLACAWTGTSYF